MNKFIVSFLALLAVNSSVYAASCTRTIYNNSNKAWTVEFATEAGDVHFISGIPCSQPKNGPCKIFAYNKEVKIEYTSDKRKAKGTVFLTPEDANSGATLLSYATESDISFCPTIDESLAAAAKGIDVNGAANGDIEFKKIK